MFKTELLNEIGLKNIKCEQKRYCFMRLQNQNRAKKKFLKKISQQCNDLRNEVFNKGSKSAKLRRKASRGARGGTVPADTGGGRGGADKARSHLTPGHRVSPRPGEVTCWAQGEPHASRGHLW